MPRSVEPAPTESSVNGASYETVQELGFTDTETARIAERVDSRIASEAEVIALDALRNLLDGAEGY